MIGMRVGLEDPVDLQAVCMHEIEHALRGRRRSAGRRRVVIEHGIDDRGPSALAIEDDMAEGGGRGIVKALDVRVHGTTVQRKIPACAGIVLMEAEVGIEPAYADLQSAA